MNGWIAVSNENENEYGHTFGGSSWHINDVNLIEQGPHLIFSLDLTDPKLSLLKQGGISALPVCSYLNCDIWTFPQKYNFDSKSSEVVFLDHELEPFTRLPADLAFEHPLQASIMGLRAMNSVELSVNGEDYWKACDEFLGGRSFIRILGPPLWLQEADDVICVCGREAFYFCSIGYECLEDYGFTGGRPFFIGEAALYFFICFPCHQITVKSQAS